MAITFDRPLSDTQGFLTQATQRQGRAQERLASGKRINDAADDPAGLAVAGGLDQDARLAVQAARNVSDGLSAARIADGALSTTNAALARLSELATQGANGTLSDPQRAALQQEFNAVRAEIDRTAATTSFNGTPLASGGQGVTVSVGATGDASAHVTVPTPDTSAAGLGIQGSDVGTAAGAQAAVTALGDATAKVTDARAQTGAAESRLVHAADNLRVQYEQSAAAAGRISDADAAEESAAATAASIQAQIGVAVAAQGKHLAGTILNLLV